MCADQELKMARKTKTPIEATDSQMKPAKVFSCSLVSIDPCLCSLILRLPKLISFRLPENHRVGKRFSCFAPQKRPIGAALAGDLPEVI